ncbi:hypothetical protein E2320_004565 [Naja naja]|nr:hypothetical protein E2320_004565 [Naja naja]
MRPSHPPPIRRRAQALSFSLPCPASLPSPKGSERKTDGNQGCSDVRPQRRRQQQEEEEEEEGRKTAGLGKAGQGRTPGNRTCIGSSLSTRSRCQSPARYVRCKDTDERAAASGEKRQLLLLLLARLPGPLKPLKPQEKKRR